MGILGIAIAFWVVATMFKVFTTATYIRTVNKALDKRYGPIQRSSNDESGVMVFLVLAAVLIAVGIYVTNY